MSKTRFDYAIDHVYCHEMVYVGKSIVQSEDVYNRYSSHINLNTYINRIKSTRQKIFVYFIRILVYNVSRKS